MNEKAYNKLSASQRYHVAQANKAVRLAMLAGKQDGELEHNLNYYTWPMLHDAYTGELNDLGRRVEEERKRRDEERRNKLNDV